MLFRWWSLFYALFIVSFLIGAALGSAYTVAVCYAVANLIYVYPAMAICGRSVDLSAQKIVMTAAGPFCAALGMAAVVYGAQTLLPVSWPAGLKLVILVALGITVYVPTVLALKLTAWLDFRQIIRDRIGRKLAPVAS